MDLLPIVSIPLSQKHRLPHRLADSPWTKQRRRLHRQLRFSGRPPVFSVSDRSLIAAQPDCSGEECRKDYQADPQTRAAQEMKRREVCQRMDRNATRHREGASFRAAAQARLEHDGEMRSVEGNLLDHADRGQR